MQQLLSSKMEFFFKENIFSHKSLELKKDTWAFVENNEFGIGFKYNNKVKAISERANNLHFSTQNKTLYIDGIYQDVKLICLTSFNIDSIKEFSYIGDEFISEETQRLIQKDPYKWWNRWKELLGNSISDSSPVSILAEMIILKYLMGKYENVYWKDNTKEKTHDITTDIDAHEVKSTIMKYDNIVHISGQNQLDNKDKPLFLYFCRLEAATDGSYSLNSMYDDLVADNYDKNRLDKIFEHSNIDLKSISSKEKYNILEIMRFKVDDSFPRINRDIFKGNVIPRGIITINYSLDLSNLDYDRIEL